VLALFLLIIDLILTAVFLITGLAYLFLGATARNIVIGVFALMGIAAVWFWYAVVRY
jgi:hypothetical protein